MTEDPAWIDELWPGDILLLRRQEPLSQLIRFVDDINHVRHVDASHAAMYLDRDSSGHPLAGSVWPMRDTDTETNGDVMAVHLLDMLGLYSGMVVMRQRNVRNLGRESWQACHWPDLRARFYDAVEWSKTNPGLVFDDTRMVAAGLTESWDDVKRFLNLPMFNEWILDRIVDAVIEDADTKDGIVCPDVFAALYQLLEGADFKLLDRSIPDPFYTISAVGFNPHLERAIILLVCLVTTEWLSKQWNQTGGRSLRIANVPSEYVTPGALARSERLVPILAVDAYGGVVARGDDVWGLPRARDAVSRELRWAPGVEPVSGAG